MVDRWQVRGASNFETQLSNCTLLRSNCMSPLKLRLSGKRKRALTEDIDIFFKKLHKEHKQLVP